MNQTTNWPEDKKTIKQQIDEFEARQKKELKSFRNVLIIGVILACLFATAIGIAMYHYVMTH